MIAKQARLPPPPPSGAQVAMTAMELKPTKHGSDASRGVEQAAPATACTASARSGCAGPARGAPLFVCACHCARLDGTGIASCVQERVGTGVQAAVSIPFTTSLRQYSSSEHVIWHYYPEIITDFSDGHQMVTDQVNFIQTVHITSKSFRENNFSLIFTSYHV